MEPQAFTLLIVEDDPAAARIVSEMLKQCTTACFWTIHADCLADALDRISQKKIDAVLLDLNLPDSQGLEGLEKITAAYPGLPVILCTGTDDEDIGTQALQRHAADYLIKGQINPNLLVRSIRYAIERKRAENAQKQSQQDLEQALKDLQQANQELNQFASIASHDLQEPLRIITLYLELLTRTYGDRLDKDAAEYIQRATEGSQDAQALIKALLLYARSGATETMEEVDLEQMFRQLISKLELPIQESGAEITHDPLPTIKANRVQMRQLFQNLLLNAIKYRSRRPLKIHIHATSGEAGWVFSVQDNGIGIDPNEHDRVFNIFQKLHSKSEYPGAGIGLAICKKIVGRHGGRIWVESQPDRGSTFHFTLPELE